MYFKQQQSSEKVINKFIHDIPCFPDQSQTGSPPDGHRCLHLSPHYEECSLISLLSIEEQPCGQDGNCRKYKGFISLDLQSQGLLNRKTPVIGLCHPQYCFTSLSVFATVVEEVCVGLVLPRVTAT
jgi:hypothetical protein